MTDFATDEAGAEKLICFVGDVLSLREAMKAQGADASELEQKKAKESKDFNDKLCDIVRQISAL